MPRLVLNRSVQIQPKSWRDFVNLIDGQALNIEGDYPRPIFRGMLPKGYGLILTQDEDALGKMIQDF